MNLVTHQLGNEKKHIFEVWSRYVKNKEVIIFIWKILSSRGDKSENIASRVMNLVIKMFLMIRNVYLKFEVDTFKTKMIWQCYIFVKYHFSLARGHDL
jgi:hypothetical protein